MLSEPQGSVGLLRKVGCAVGCGLALFFNVDLCSVAQACPGPKLESGGQ